MTPAVYEQTLRSTMWFLRSAITDRLSSNRPLKENERRRFQSMLEELDAFRALFEPSGEGKEIDLWDDIEFDISRLVMLAFKIATMTHVSEPTARQVMDTTSAKARTGRKRNFNSRLEILRSFIANNPILRHTKFVDNNIIELKRAAKSVNISEGSRSTWIKAMESLGYGPKKTD